MVYSVSSFGDEPQWKRLSFKVLEVLTNTVSLFNSELLPQYIVRTKRRDYVPTKKD